MDVYSIYSIYIVAITKGYMANEELPQGRPGPIDAAPCRLRNETHLV